MVARQVSRFCLTCQRYTLHHKEHTGAGSGCVVLILLGIGGYVALGGIGATLGVLGGIGLLFVGALIDVVKKPICQFCGGRN